MKLKQKLSIGLIRAKFKMLTFVSKRKAAEKAFDLFCTPFMKSRLRTPSIFNHAEKLQFKLNGLRVNGFRWNHPRKKKALILHGFGSAAHKFHQYISPLLQKEYEVIAFDAPAHGTSEGTRINAVQYCQMIQEVIDAYGPFDSYLAHSFGGMALSLALENRVHSDQTKIVFIAPATETTSAIDSAFHFLQLKDEMVRKEFDKIIFEQSGQPSEWFSIKRAMQNISATVLWIHDEDDDITPLTDALKVRDEHFDNIEFIITKGLGHRQIYVDNNIKSKVIQFL